MDCIFCKITRKETPSDIVFENDDLMVFKDNYPKAPVHLLTVPKKHITSIMELRPDDVVLMGQLIYEARNAAEKFGLDGYKLAINVGRKGGQVVDHVHLHILGGWDQDVKVNEIKV